MLGPPAVWVVVLNWKGAADTLDCLQSLKRLRYPNAAAVVVDNGSGAGEADGIEATGLACAVLRQPENRGYAAGCNVGIRHALERGADYVWLLNNDTVVDPRCLDALVAAGERDARVGLLSPVLYDYDAPHAIQFAGTVVDLPGERRPTLTSLDDPAVRAHEGRLALWGTALLVKRRVVEAVGLLDERYFAYVEDMDYCVRAMAAGFRTRLVRDASVYHKHGFRIADREGPFREYLVTRNEYLFWTTHLHGWQRWSYRMRYIPWVLRRVIDAGLEGRPGAEEFIASGGWDALRGR
ncbi:MAG TPA: glycosyltransferase family 2 protein, partial [Methylomirabilota bacterium]|nr:glycosyltransferase family 2 protein [Methylomirabilota bacterium]